MSRVLYIDDEIENLEVFHASFFNHYDIYITNSTDEAEKTLKEKDIHVVITDQRMPGETGLEFIDRIHGNFPGIVFMILSGYVDFEIARKALENGHVYRFILKPYKEEEIKLDIDNAIIKHNLIKQNQELIKDLARQNIELRNLKKMLENENQYFKEEIKNYKDFENIITIDRNFEEILEQTRKVSKTEVNVFISGETGTGKELIARAIHNLSNRNKNAFVCLNCAAIPESIFESELFGHEKGAFTGAIEQRIGKLELANNGTLFLDEIGEMPINLQPKLLRAIQDKAIERLGGNKRINLDIRIIVATNRDIEKEIELGKFRSDLFYRLNVFPIKVPPLRNRPNDIEILVNNLTAKFNKIYGTKITRISKKELEYLKMYPWPGNIRELENVVERAVITCTNGMLNLSSFIPSKEKTNYRNITNLEEIERLHILKILEKTSWKISGENGAASLLGLKRTTLQSKMIKLNISQQNDAEMTSN